MSAAILEVNDLELHLLTPSGESHRSAGYVYFGEEVLFGQSAKNRHWLEPSRSDARFWALLGTQSLASQQFPVRHRADIAYAQLKMLWQKSEAKQLVLLVHSSLNQEQLGLLVGMCEALPDCKVSAVVSSALMSALAIDPQQSPKEFLVADLGLHQLECYAFQREGSFMKEKEHIVFNDAGAYALEESVARYAANQYIDTHRYDPQHTAEGDQALHNEIANWLIELKAQSAIKTKLATNQGHSQVGLQKGKVSQLIASRLQSFVDFAKNRQTPLYVSSHLEHWLSFINELNFQTLSKDAAVKATSSRQSELIKQCQPLHRIDGFNCGESPPETQAQQQDSGKNDTPLATHIMIEGIAYELNELHLKKDGQGEITACSSAANADVSVRLKDQQVEITRFSDRENTNGNGSANPDVQRYHAHAGQKIELFERPHTLIKLAGP